MRSARCCSRAIERPSSSSPGAGVAGRSWPAPRRPSRSSWWSPWPPPRSCAACPAVGPAPLTGPTADYIPTGLANCPLTKPDGSFTPPPESGTDWDVEANVAWYGTRELWTLLDRDGEVWTGLPRSELGLGQKTFWWRQGYRVDAEPQPEIYVLGERLDGPGRFAFGPGTNAFWGLGSAMLVGIDVPEGGCWELTARYYTKRLSYVVWVEDAG